jgi:hypothetical protein
MRYLMILCIVVCAALTVSIADAATPGQISDNTLAEMGLAGMQSMSDVQGTEVRGMGFGRTAVTTATSYAATSSHGNTAVAAGSASASGKKALSVSAGVAMSNVFVHGTIGSFTLGVKGPVAVSVSVGVAGR